MKRQWKKNWKEWFIKFFARCIISNLTCLQWNLKRVFMNRFKNNFLERKPFRSSILNLYFYKCLEMTRLKIYFDLRVHIRGSPMVPAGPEFQGALDSPSEPWSQQFPKGGDSKFSFRGWSLPREAYILWWIKKILERGKRIKFIFW